jgi:hypothetical protein
MTADKQKLKALAERVPADSNIWHVAKEHESSQYQGYMVVDGWRCHVASTGMGNSDGITADFIAAANPAAVLELIAEIERLSAPIDELLCCNFCRCLIRPANQLKAENESLRKALTTIRDESHDIGACECAADALVDSRKDAGHD